MKGEKGDENDGGDNQILKIIKWTRTLDNWLLLFFFITMKNIHYGNFPIKVNTKTENKFQLQNNG